MSIRIYAVGRVPAYQKDIAPLALERSRALELTEDTFTVDPALDPKRYETEAFGVTWEKPMTVVVRFRADQAPFVREREWHPTQRFRTVSRKRPTALSAWSSRRGILSEGPTEPWLALN
ncbi:MAG: WYL domain-containing protein [Candidatus Rokubacteria bacterium]|nr:WYL domain-containing protein [Candidatus Rokubacteria bacterium]